MPLDKPRPVTTIKIRNINVHWYMGRTIERGIQGVPLTPGPGFFLGAQMFENAACKTIDETFFVRDTGHEVGIGDYVCGQPN